MLSLDECISASWVTTAALLAGRSRAARASFHALVSSRPPAFNSRCASVRACVGAANYVPPPHFTLRSCLVQAVRWPLARLRQPATNARATGAFFACRRPGSGHVEPASAAAGRCRRDEDSRQRAYGPSPALASCGASPRRLAWVARPLDMLLWPRQQLRYNSVIIYPPGSSAQVFVTIVVSVQYCVVRESVRLLIPSFPPPWPLCCALPI